MAEQLKLAAGQTLKWGLSQPDFRDLRLAKPIAFSVEFREYAVRLIGEIGAIREQVVATPAAD